MKIDFFEFLNRRCRLSYVFAAGTKWPPSLGESLATELTWWGCMVPTMGCVKYSPEVTVRIGYVFTIHSVPIREIVVLRRIERRN